MLFSWTCTLVAPTAIWGSSFPREQVGCSSTHSPLGLDKQKKVPVGNHNVLLGGVGPGPPAPLLTELRSNILCSECFPDPLAHLRLSHPSQASSCWFLFLTLVATCSDTVFMNCLSLPLGSTHVSSCSLLYPLDLEYYLACSRHWIFYFLNKNSFYLKDRELLSIYWLTPQTPLTARPGPGRSQEPGILSLPKSSRGPSTAASQGVYQQEPGSEVE